jgi:hypothetical protein
MTQSQDLILKKINFVTLEPIIITIKDKLLTYTYPLFFWYFNPKLPFFFPTLFFF